MAAWILRIIVLSALGAVISIITAWRFAVRSPVPPVPGLSLPTPEALALWARHIDEPIHDRRIEASRTTRPGVTWLQVGTPPQEAPTAGWFPPPSSPRYAEWAEEHGIDVDEHRCWVIHAGWPLPCVEGEQHETRRGTLLPFRTMPTTTHHEATCPLPRSFGPIDLRGDRLLPWRPLWLGLAANSALFGAVLVTLLVLVLALRRRARLDRRTCPRCRYSLQGLDPDGDETVTCPECGTVIDAKLLERPRQILRWWMWLFLTTPALPAVSWFLGLGRIHWFWSQAAYYGTIFRPLTIVALALVMVWLFMLCQRSYHDRPPRARHALSAVIALGLTGIFFGSLFVLLGWWNPF